MNGQSYGHDSMCAGNPHLGNLLNTLDIIILSIENFLWTPEIENASKSDQNSEISRVSVGFEKQDLRHFSTSGGSKKFSMGDMMMSKVFKRLP